MPTSKGLLDYISDIEKIETEQLAVCLKFKGDTTIIENQLGHLLLYPQIVPITKADSDFDVAVLKELLKLESINFYNPNLKKIYIPEVCTHFFPNLSELAFLFIDNLKPVNLTAIYLKSNTLGIKNLGTYIKPDHVVDSCFLDIYIDQQKFRVLAGNIAIIPTKKQKIDLKLESNCNIIEGKNEFITEVIGGDIGLIVDLCQLKS